MHRKRISVLVTGIAEQAPTIVGLGRWRALNSSSWLLEENDCSIVVEFGLRRDKNNSSWPSNKGTQDDTSKTLVILICRLLSRVKRKKPQFASLFYLGVAHSHVLRMAQVDPERPVGSHRDHVDGKRRRDGRRLARRPRPMQRTWSPRNPGSVLWSLSVIQTFMQEVLNKPEHGGWKIYKRPGLLEEDVSKQWLPNLQGVSTFDVLFNSSDSSPFLPSMCRKGAGSHRAFHGWHWSVVQMDSRWSKGQNMWPKPRKVVKVVPLTLECSSQPDSTHKISCLSKPAQTFLVFFRLIVWLGMSGLVSGLLVTLAGVQNLTTWLVWLALTLFLSQTTEATTG